MSHTKEPWKIDSDSAYSESQLNADGYIRDDEEYICTTGDGKNWEADIRRIVACVNACRGLPTKELEDHGIVSAVGNVIGQLEQRNAELDALSSAISRDCNAVALERNDYREKLHLANTRIAELVEALNKYGEHRPSCTFYPSDPDMIDPLSNQCTCGLEQALAAQKVSS